MWTNNKKIKMGILSLVFILLTMFAGVWGCNQSEITITFISDGEVYAVKTGINGKIGLPSSPTNRDRVFLGWYLSPPIEGGEDVDKPEINPPAMPSDEINGVSKYTGNVVKVGKEATLTVYAWWDEIRYSVEYVNTGSGEMFHDNPVSFARGEGLILKPARLTYYTFEGWSFAYGEYISEIPKGTDNPVRVYANFTPIAYPVFYELDGGVNAPENKYMYTREDFIESEMGTSILLGKPIKDGFVFDGWYQDEQLTQRVEYLNIYHLNRLTLYAKWREGRLDDFVFEKQANGEYWVVGIPYGNTVVDIPDQFEGLRVSGIGNEVFLHTHVREIILHGELSNLVDALNCSQVERVIFADDCEITRLTQTLGFGGDDLKYVRLPKNLKELPPNLFQNCYALEQVVLPKGLVTISTAFSGCRSLKEIVIPEGVTSIEQNAFSNCENLSRVILPSGLEEIKNYAFAYSPSLREVNLPSSLVYIGSHAFDGAAITEVVIPKNIPVLKSHVFANCTQLQTVTFAQDSVLTHVEEGAFFCTKLLKTLRLPLTVLSFNLFAISASGLSGLYLPKGLVELYPNAGIVNVTAYCEGTRNDYNIFVVQALELNFKQVVWDCFNQSESSQGYVFFTAENGNEYDYLSSTRELTLLKFSESIPAGLVDLTVPVLYKGEKYSLTRIGASVFSGNSEVVTVRLPASLSKIGRLAFYACNNLQTVEIEGGNVPLVIQSESFSDCSRLETFDFPMRLNTIEYGSFYQCRSLVRAVLPDTLRSIEYNAFAFCAKLTEVVLPIHLNYLGDCAFLDCVALQEIRIPRTLTRLNPHTFSGCSSLRQVSFAPYSSLTSLGFNVFSKCSLLRSIEIPALVQVIEARAFDLNQSLETVTFASEYGVEIIGESAFALCQKLKNITLPKSLNILDFQAFYGCDSLGILYLPSALHDFSISGMDQKIIYSDDGGILGYRDEQNVVIYPNFSTDTIAIDDVVYSRVGNVVFVSSAQGARGDIHIRSYVTISGVSYPVTQIGKYAFFENKNIVSVHFAEDSPLCKIQESAFLGATNLQKINLPENLEVIDAGAFFYCSRLEKLLLPAMVTRLEDSFYETSAILYTPLQVGMIDMAYDIWNIVYDYPQREVLRDGHIPYIDKQGNLYGLYKDYGELNYARLVAYRGEETNVVLPDFIVYKGKDYPVQYIDSAFKNNHHIVEVTFGSHVIELSSLAFSNCTSLKKVNINSALRVIWSFAFERCTSLETIEFAPTSRLSNVKNGAFKDCQKLTRVLFPSTLVELHTDAFSGCISLDELILSKNVILISDKAMDFNLLTELDTLVLDSAYVVRAEQTTEFNGLFAKVSVVYVSEQVVDLGSVLSTVFVEVESDRHGYHKLVKNVF